MFLKEVRQETQIRETTRDQFEQSKSTELVGDVGTLKVDTKNPWESDEGEEHVRGWESNALQLR